MVMTAMLPKERMEVMALMKSFDDAGEGVDEPCVGIFWYSTDRDELFGVTKEEASSIPFDANGRKTVALLHKDWWRRRAARDKAKGRVDSIYMADYTMIPRGRIFQTMDGVFRVMCGSWMTDHIMELIEDEFYLDGKQVQAERDEHWELGHGWSDEML